MSESPKTLQAPQPGPHHKVLEQDVGTWEASVVVRPMPDAPPIPSHGAMRSRLACGGMWLISDFQNETTGFEGHGVYGFDPHKQRYVSTWIDNARTFLAMGEGVHDATARTMTYTYEVALPGRTVRWREITEAPDADTRVFRTMMPGPQGEFEMMTVTYRRVSVLTP